MPLAGSQDPRQPVGTIPQGKPIRGGLQEGPQKGRKKAIVQGGKAEPQGPLQGGPFGASPGKRRQGEGLARSLVELLGQLRAYPGKQGKEEAVGIAGGVKGGFSPTSSEDHGLRHQSPSSSSSSVSSATSPLLAGSAQADSPRYQRTRLPPPVT